jgi:NAD-dependent deacetylase
MSVISDEIPPKLIHLLRRSEAITVLTGAGISAESGVPTFRAAQTGLWSQYNPAELATPEAFLDNPALVWEWYTWRRELIAAAQPNPGHYSLVEMEKQVSDFSLITQNVDGLHRVAGSQNLIELHGNIQRTKCSADNTIINRWSNVGEVPPRCPDCNNYLRPDVVWFGEDLHAGTLAAAQKKAAGCQVFFSIGTSSIIYPAASLPQIALDNAAVVVEVNPQTTPLTPSATFKLSGPAGEVLPPLIEKTWQS